MWSWTGYVCIVALALAPTPEGLRENDSLAKTPGVLIHEAGTLATCPAGGRKSGCNAREVCGVMPGTRPSSKNGCRSCPEALSQTAGTGYRPSNPMEARAQETRTWGSLTSMRPAPRPALEQTPRCRLWSPVPGPRSRPPSPCLGTARGGWEAGAEAALPQRGTAESETTELPEARPGTRVGGGAGSTHEGSHGNCHSRREGAAQAV